MQPPPPLPTRHSSSAPAKPRPVSFPPPGHRLLPRWISLLAALPKLGTVRIVSRNRHLLVGCAAAYPEVPALASPFQLIPRLSAWKHGWYYREVRRGAELHAIEFRDQQGTAFHKILFPGDLEGSFAGTLLKAFEQEPLSSKEIGQALKANRLDGARCSCCRERLAQGPGPVLLALRDCLQRAVERKLPIRVTLQHEALRTAMRFVPDYWSPRGLWLGVEGGGCCLYLRGHGLGETEPREVEVPGVGLCREFRLREPDGFMAGSLLLEEPI